MCFMILLQNGNLQDLEELLPTWPEHGVFLRGQQDHHLHHRLCLRTDRK